NYAFRIQSEFTCPLYDEIAQSYLYSINSRGSTKKTFIFQKFEKKQKIATQVPIPTFSANQQKYDDVAQNLLTISSSKIIQVNIEPQTDDPNARVVVSDNKQMPNPMISQQKNQFSNNTFIQKYKDKTQLRFIQFSKYQKESELCIVNLNPNDYTKRGDNDMDINSIMQPESIDVGTEKHDSLEWNLSKESN
ncbi:hypothetical protein IMG5_006610, partial [Ichthyophthirius multifiliis]